MTILTILTPTFGCTETMLAHYNWYKSLDEKNIQMIIVDQNHNINEDLLMASCIDELFVYLHSTVKGLSLNRNFAFEHVKGDYTIFLDDDARFYNDSLEQFFKCIRNNHSDIYLASIVDSAGILTSYTPSKKWVNIDKLNIRGHVNSNGLICKSSFFHDIKFDEKMGVGAYYGSCEEVDFTLKVLQKGGLVTYEPSLKIVHPPVPYGEQKAYSYGLGHGYITKKLLFDYTGLKSKLHAVANILKNLCKIILYYFTPNKNYKASATGFFKGFFKGINE
jgi:glycosyltransferase involved in cell wall biosynthesis